MKFLAALAGLAAATDICLPDTHSAWVHQYRDEVRYDHRRPDEYKLGDHVHLWYCKSAQKTLVHIHEDDDHYKSPAHGFLRDYASKSEWFWDWSNGTASNCEKRQIDKPMEAQCLAYQTTLKGNGTIGQDYAVDYYDHRVINKEKHYEFEVSTLVEAGSTTKPVEQKIRGAKAENGQKIVFYERVELFDINTQPIAGETWDLPSNCPK